jgi:hypothetical protein
MPRVDQRQLAFWKPTLPYITRSPFILILIFEAGILRSETPDPRTSSIFFDDNFHPHRIRSTRSALIEDKVRKIVTRFLVYFYSDLL